ncbi:hypothetical protein HDU98_002210 [Podochytrium sp. JEL0797]|nr:hypothetical protein HDU98_002210 [Podochytrium sp. JEL0797]
MQYQEQYQQFQYPAATSTPTRQFHPQTQHIVHPQQQTSAQEYANNASSIYASSAPASSGFMHPSTQNTAQHFQHTHHHQNHNQQPCHFNHHQNQQQSQPTNQYPNPYPHHQNQPTQHKPPTVSPPSIRPLSTIPPPAPILPPLHTLSASFLQKYTPNPKLLGSGGFGFVTTAVRVSDGVDVAVKFILRDKVPVKGWARDSVLGVVPTEVYILKSVNHPNVIKYLDYFSDNTYLYLVTEKHGGSWVPLVSSPISVCDNNSATTTMMTKSPTVSLASSSDTLVNARNQTNTNSSSSSTTASTGNTSSGAATVLEPRNSCDLFECIEYYGRLSEEKARHVFKQIVSAVHHLATLNIIHRDIKDENILIDKDFTVKLIDFGSATFLDEGGNVVDGLFLGTLQYAAPEILSGNPYFGPQCEVWSLGCCLYIMLCGEAPFESPKDIVRSNGPLAPPRNVVLSSSVSRLIACMLEKDPRRRATVAEVLGSEWVGAVVGWKG